MFELHSGELIISLSKRADALAQKMLVHMTKKNQEESERFHFFAFVQLLNKNFFFWAKDGEMAKSQH